jgi:hypothetical protein
MSASSSSIRNVVLCCVLSLAVSSRMRAAEDVQSLTPRQLFYTTGEQNKPTPKQKIRSNPRPKPSSNAPVNPPPSGVLPSNTSKPTPTPAPPLSITKSPYLGLRYSLLQPDSDGRLHEVDPDKIFRTGDKLHLKFRSNNSAYLYLIHRGSVGDWQVLYPSAEISNGNNHLNAGEELVVPGGTQEDFVFDKDPGEEKIFAVLSRQREPDLEKLLQSIRQAERPVADVGTRMALNRPTVPGDEFERLRGRLAPRGIRVQHTRVDQPVAGGQSEGAKPENAVYVVNASTDGTSQRVVTQIVLKHE